MLITNEHGVPYVYDLCCPVEDVYKRQTCSRPRQDGVVPLRGGGFFLKGFDFRAFLCYRLAFMNLRCKFIGRPPNWVSHTCLLYTSCTARERA